MAEVIIAATCDFLPYFRTLCFNALSTLCCYLSLCYFHLASHLMIRSIALLCLDEELAG